MNDFVYVEELNLNIVKQHIDVMKYPVIGYEPEEGLVVLRISIPCSWN